MTSVLVVVPVLGRPERVAPLAVSLDLSIRDVPVSLLFVCSPGDAAELDACNDARVNGADFRFLTSIGFGVVEWEPGQADWARKVNWAYETTDDEWIFTGADDLSFLPGWADEAVRVGIGAEAGVVGTNDLGNPRVTKGSHATHSLVARWYADTFGTIDGPEQVVSEAYDHNFVDDELVQTAKARGKFVFAHDSHVEHLHPNWEKGENDATYEKGQANFAADRTLFIRRRRRILRARR